MPQRTTTCAEHMPPLSREGSGGRSLRLHTLLVVAMLVWARSASARTVVVANSRVRVAFDTARGTYGVMTTGAVTELRVQGAALSVDGWSTRDPGRRCAAAVRRHRDRIGPGWAIAIRSSGTGPQVLGEIVVYDAHDFVAVRVGLDRPASPTRVQRIDAVADATAFPRLTPRADVRTLDGEGGAGATHVQRGATRHSPNNVLLTFRSPRGRRSLVLGGLTYTDWLKFAATNATGGGRRSALAQASPPGWRLVSYTDLGGIGRSASNGPTIKVRRGTPFTWAGAVPVAASCFSSVVFDDREVVLEAAGLRPGRRYVLGFSWWDFDNNGRLQSVWCAGPDGHQIPLVSSTKLPAFLAHQEGPREHAVALPASAIATGHATISFTREAPTPNAVVSEAWLWECPASAAIPSDLAAGRPALGSSPAESPTGPIPISLYAADPVGRLVRPGETYLPNDWFYIGAAEQDPFRALERYGLAVRQAQGARPNPYDFPTECAWYAGLFDWPQASNDPLRSRYGLASTPGLVDEMRIIRDRGFLNYSRAAVRLVPDTYSTDNEQGWWDDAHWARFNHYRAPYETSRKYADAVRALGGLPFTYFQLIFDSRDFRLAHPEMLLGGDPQRRLDYTNPRTREHMRRVYRNLRDAGMAGMMFDYPNDYWGAELVRGGFADPVATAAAAYRSVFALAKAGLGPNSWVHERVLGEPNSDITTGVQDSQRVWGDTNQVSAEMIARCGLRWYKSRVLTAYDTDAKHMSKGWLGVAGPTSEADGRRMMLTMCYVATSRFLLGSSFRDMSAEALYDLERTFPYHAAPQSARPIDAFVRDGWPQVYAFTVSPAWRQVTLHNNLEPARAALVTVPLSGQAADGALGLERGASYYAYDFWNDRLVGRIPGSGALTQQLRPGEARMLSVHRVEPHPQLLSTNRHIMQGYVDMPGRPSWNAASRVLSGRSRVVAGEPYRIILADNGYVALRAMASGASARLLSIGHGLSVVELRAEKNRVVEWAARYGPTTRAKRR